MVDESAQSPDAAADAASLRDGRLLDVQRVSKRFVTSEGVITAVEDVSFSIAPGEFVSIIGPSGCGKSTLFNIVGGLVGDYEGRVTVAGDVVRGTHPAIGMVFQEESTFPWRTVVENVAFPLEVAGMSKDARLDGAEHFVAMVGLRGFERRFPAELSGGMRQGVALARTLASEPRILLMEEPFAGLAVPTRPLPRARVVQIGMVELAIRGGLVHRFIVALRAEIIVAIPRVIVEENVLHRFWQTAQEVLWASLLLAGVGIPLGALLHRFRIVRLACETWVGALASAPTVLMYPLFLVIFGRSATTIVMIGFAAGLAPVILKTLEGLAGTRQVLLNVGRSFKLTSSQQFWKILLPAALPAVFVGLKLGLIFAMINIVGVEFLVNFGGLLHRINQPAARHDLPGTYGAICFVILTSVVVFALTERLERWLRPGK